MFHKQIQRRILIFSIVCLLTPNFAGALTMKEILQGYDNPKPMVLGATIFNVPAGADPVANGAAFRTALANAQCGDTIVLTAGAEYETYTYPNSVVGEPFKLTNKTTGCNGTESDYITIRTSNISDLPAEGSRVGLEHMSAMAKLVTGNNYSVLKFMPGAHHWKIVGIEFRNTLAASQKGHTPNLVDGDDNTPLGLEPKNIIFDRSIFHPIEDITQPDSDFRSANRGIHLDGVNITIKNSYFSNFTGKYYNSNEMIDTEAILIISGPGPYLIENNFLEAWFNNIFTGGGGAPSTNTAILSTGATASEAVFSNTSNLDVGDLVAFKMPVGENKTARVTAINGNLVSYKGEGPSALVSSPLAPGGAAWDGSAPGNITIIRNTFHKRPEWEKFGICKSYYEVKSAIGLVIEGNTFLGASCNLIGITVRNQNGTTPWTTVKNVKISNNIFKAKGYFTIALSDEYRTIENGQNVEISNNIVNSINTQYYFILGKSGNNIKIFHNTVRNVNTTPSGMMLGISNTLPAEGLVFKDNIISYGNYGLACSDDVNISGCWPGYSTSNNVIIDTRWDKTSGNIALKYPSSFVVNTEAEVGFVNSSLAFENYHNWALASNSQFKNKASDGKDPGVDFAMLDAALSGASVSVIPTPAPSVVPTPTQTPTVTPTPTPVPTVDTTAPVISAVTSSSITSTSARITWTTNEASDSQIEYGLSSSYGSLSPIDSILTLNHTVNFSNLTPNTTYYYRVKSRDSSGNLSVSSGQSFTTASASVTPTPTPTPTPTVTPTQTTQTGEWYNQSFNYKKTITINKTQVQGSHSNFPVLISITDPELKSTSNLGKVASTQGYDLVFTSSSNTKLSHEIEKYDPSTGELIAWVKVPSISSLADVSLNLYFGNSSATDQQDKANVWSDYRFVHHLNDGDSTTTNFYQDSTANNIDATLIDVDGDSVQGVGKVGYGYNFSGDADYMELLDTTNLTQFTLSAWIKYATSVPVNIITRTNSAGPSIAWSHQMSIDGSFKPVNYLYDQNAIRSRCIQSSDSTSQNTWYYIANTAINGQGMGLYLDGVVKGTSPLDTLWTKGDRWRIAQNTGILSDGSNACSNIMAPSYFGGLLDEIRLSSIVRSADWIKTEYNNQSNPSAFVSVSSSSVYVSTPTPTPTPTPVATPTPTNTTPTPNPTPGLPIVTFQNTPAPTPTPFNTTQQPQQQQQQTTNTNATSSTNSVPLKLINQNGTYYVVKEGKRLGITNPGMLFSHGLEFKDARTATAGDINLPVGPLLLPGEGALVKSPTNPTVYLISRGLKHGFNSEATFRTLGFSFTKVLTVTTPELDKMAVGSVISDPKLAHLPGTDINIQGTIYYIGSDNKRYGYPSQEVWNSWHFDNDFSNVVIANSADLSLPVGDVVPLRKIE